MDNELIIIAMAFAVINLYSFSVMWVDKIKSALPEAKRISEGMMFFMAVAFGSLGVYAGMFAFRHKTKKWHFLLGIPLVFIENAAFLYLLYLFVSSNLELAF